MNRTQQGKTLLWIVIPCFNEEEVLPETAPMFLAELSELVNCGLVAPDSTVCFVDDGSNDKTWEIIEQLSSEQELIAGVKLSRNQGHQNALMCGLAEAQRAGCDAVISIDCDGQDDVSVIGAMTKRYLEGFEVIYGVRSDRDSDTVLKRKSAQLFYKAMSFLGADVIYNHADCRLLSSRALEALFEFPERNLFLRGLVPLVGFKSSTIEYSRAKRIAGESHYPLSKMLHLALDGITSMSVKPIRIISAIGVLFSMFGCVGIIWALVAFATGGSVAGWASTVIIICLIGGVQLLALGVIGEYVGKIYLEVKRRPRYIIERRTD